jgi:Mce-associated membrane protein
VADKDVKVTEAARDEDAALVGAIAKRAEPTDTAPDAHIVDDAKPTDGKPAADAPPMAEDAPPTAEDAPPTAEDAPPTAEDAPPTAEDAQPTADARAAEEAQSARRSWRIAATLGAVAVVLAGFGVWATLHASNLRSNAAAQANTALTDGPATATVRREISAAVNTIFSYNYANTAATRLAAQRVLTGPAVRQYNTLFALVTKNAPAQKLVVTTKVTNSGVELLDGNRARLLVFANQQDTRAGTGQTSYAGAMFAVTALRQGGRWKIENIDTFGG